MVRRVIGAAVVSAACLAGPATASAATFYASQTGASTPACPAANPCSLPAAITQADAALGRDTVQVVGSLQTTGGVDLSASPIDLVGSGQGLDGTIVDVKGGSALRLANGSTVSRLMARSDGDVAVLDNGSLLRSARIEGSGAGATGVLVGPGGTGDTMVEQSTIVLPQGGASRAVAGAAGAAGTLTVADSSLTAGTGIDVRDRVVVVRDTLDVSADGVRVSQGSLVASSTVIVAHGPTARGVVVSAAGSTPASADLRQLTIDASVPAAASRGIAVTATGLPAATVTLRGSIVRGFGADLERSGRNARLSVGTSDFHSASGAPDVSPGGNVDATPGYAAPASGDYRLARASPVVDEAGTAAPAGAESPTDRAGHPRLADGNGDGVAERDMGALERRPLVAALLVAPVTIFVGQTVSFDASGSAYPDGTISSYRFNLDGNATFERSTGTSASTSRSYAHAGTFRVTVRVGADDGSVSEASRTIVVRADTTDPVLSRVSISHRTMSIAAEPTAYFGRLAPRGTTFGFALSEPGTLRAIIEKRGKGREVGKECARANRSRRRRRLCVRYVSLGTLTRRVGAGGGTLDFSGRMGNRAVPVGTYRAVLRATDAAGNRSKFKFVSFRVVLR